MSDMRGQGIKKGGTRVGQAAAGLLALLLLGAAPAAGARAADRARLAEARQQYLAQEYEQVIRLLAPLVSSPTATISDKVEGYELMGLSYLILGENKSAREAFENLLGLDPGHVLRDPSGSPKLRRFFEAVKQSFVPGYQPRARVTLEHSAPAKATAGQAVELVAVVVQGTQEVAEVQLHWRRSGLLSYEAARMQRRGKDLSASFVLPTDPSGYRLEYYLEARDGSGQVLTRLGAPDRPLGLEVKGAAGPTRGRPVYKRWWFWTVIGAVVVGGAVTTGVLVSRETAPEGNLSPGIIRLR
jgi:hypothetical protein